MKRFMIFALIAAFVLAAGVASAKEITMSGQFEVGAEWLDNTNFLEGDDDNTSEDDFEVNERARMFFNYVDSENLSGTIAFEMNAGWGNGAGAKGTDQPGVLLKHAYVDFNWPDTALNLRAGLQGVALPAAVAGSPVIDDDVSALMASYPVNDNVSVVAGWVRLYDNDMGDDAGTANLDDEVDALALIVPITMDGFSFTPYGLYAMVGKDSTIPTGLTAPAPVTPDDSLTGLWLGGALSVSALDPIVLAADLIYGSVSGDDDDNNDRDGWFFTAIAQYKMDMVTPGIFFAYGSGEDDDVTNGSEVMPTLGGVYNATSFGFDGAAPRGTGNLLSGGGTEYSAWVIGAGLYGFSFVEKMNHTVRVAYGRGTNDDELITGGAMTSTRAHNGSILVTKEDSFWEVNFDTTYSLYEALTAYVQLGYINVDLDEDTWGSAIADNTQDAWKLLLALKYSY